MICRICGNPIDDEPEYFGGYDGNGNLTHVHRRCFDGAIKVIKSWNRGDFHEQKKMYDDAVALVEWAMRLVDDDAPG